MSENWQIFADNNNAEGVHESTLLHKNLFDFITDKTCHCFYQLIMDRVRQEKIEMYFDYRCDSPDVRRFMPMIVLPSEDDSLIFHSSIVKEESRESVRLLEQDVERSEEFLSMCSWCKCIKVDEDIWMEVEHAVEVLGIFYERTLPKITHGMCRRCYERVKQNIPHRNVID